jgi:Ca-activated chloride channel family protein
MKDSAGAVVLSRLDDSTLQDLTQTTNGVYRHAAGWIDLNDLIVETVEKGQAGRFLEERAVRRIERFQWFLAPAVLLALLSLWRELPSLPRSRRLQKNADRRQRRKARASLAAALLVGAWLTLPPPRLFAQAMTPPEPPDPEPIREIVTRLAGGPDVQPADWIDLARETITFGQTVRQAGQPVPEGPVYDALQGIDLGEQSSPDAADWDGLRAELLALLEEPDQQDQQQQQDDQNEENEENEEQENQEQQDQQQQNQDQQSGKQDDQQNQQEEGNQQEQQENQEQQEDEQQQDPATRDEQEEGKSEEPETPPEEPEQDDSEMQTIGGETSPQELPDDPELAAAMQELEQVRNQDSPARLFRILEGEPPEDSKTRKNW